jgi:hypothetical protein
VTSLARTICCSRLDHGSRLDDLECGKDFYAVYTPKKQEIDLRVRREFGGTIG